MADSGVFWSFLALALAVPVLLFWTVRLMARVLPPPYNWLVAFFQRHPLPMAYAEAALWSFWCVRTLRDTDKSWADWAFCVFAGLLAAESLSRVWRARSRHQSPQHPVASA